ncbi:MAG: hypothetical protein U0835_07305 [Isosphaeraceae bacterium]
MPGGGEVSPSEEAPPRVAVSGRPRSSPEAESARLMGRRPLNRMELRAAAEAAEALGLNTPSNASPAPSRPSAPQARGDAACGSSGPSATSAAGPSPPSTTPKPHGEELAADLKARGKEHFVRSLKKPMG